MTITANFKFLSVLAICVAVVAVPTMALTQEPTEEDKAISQRRAFMQLILRSFGPLAGMAKGEMTYDAEAAQAHANNLRALTGYNVGGLFVPGSSNADRPGTTRALPVIWEKLDEFASRYGDLGGAMVALAEAAGQGQGALAAAVGNAGKACGACHENFRTKDF